MVNILKYVKDCVANSSPYTLAISIFKSKPRDYCIFFSTIGAMLNNQLKKQAYRYQTEETFGQG